MSMNVAHFPHLGPIANPTLDDYRTELSLMAEIAERESRYQKAILWNNWRRWLNTVRRLEWAQSAREGRERTTGRKELAT